VLNLLNSTPWRRMEKWMYISTFSLTSALAGGEWSASRPDRFTPGETAPGTLWIGGWVDPRAGLDDVEKGKFLTLPGFELRLLGRSARTQSLYRLRYPGSFIAYINTIIPWCQLLPGNSWEGADSHNPVASLWSASGCMYSLQDLGVTAHKTTICTNTFYAEGL
jgi:hypothetical protein